MSEYQGLHASPAEWPRALFYVALAFSCYQIITAAFHPVSTQVLRAGHVGFLLMLVYLVYPVRGSDRPWQPLAWVLALAGMATFFYQWYFEADLIQRSGDLTTADMVIGLMLIALVFEAARRVMGIALPIICGLFLAYGLFGNHLPGDLAHRGYGLDQIVNQLSFGTEGLYGTPTYVSATYIFLFILFGSFLEQAGMIRLFTDFAMGLFGHRAGGPAKVSVVSSALMGTITGSGVANVVTTGQFTIPLMKRFGYKPAFAGGVEATASMGGQLMPPVMGAVAFIMAETLNVPYADIVKAAIIPAVLYFYGAFWMVHLEAGKHGLMGMDKKDLPSPLNALKKQWYLVIPLLFQRVQRRWQVLFIHPHQAVLAGLQVDHPKGTIKIQNRRNDRRFYDVRIRHVQGFGHDKRDSAHHRRHQLTAHGCCGLDATGKRRFITKSFHQGNGELPGGYHVGYTGAGNSTHQG